MSAHGKNMKDIGTTAKLKNVFIIAKWRSFETTKRSGSAWLLQSLKSRGRNAEQEGRTRQGPPTRKRCKKEEGAIGVLEQASIRPSALLLLCILALPPHCRPCSIGEPNQSKA